MALDELWKKFKTSHEIKKALPKEGDTAVDTLNPPKVPERELDTSDDVLNAFEAVELESLQNEKLYQNLSELKNLVEGESEKVPLDVRFMQINKYLGLEEKEATKKTEGTPLAHETVRHERWPNNIHCPTCQSVNLKRLAQLPPTSQNKHRYRCLDCGTLFNDDSDTPLEHGIPPINVWMQCWYLMGCGLPINYIAKKLNVDLSTVEMMTQQLKRTFNAEKPLTRFMGFDEWNKQAESLRRQLKEDLLRLYERLNANVATAPKDTVEFRRQQNLRRELKVTPEPPSPFGKRR